MGKITVETCEIEGLKILTPQVFGDNRGYFMETYNYNDYKAAGIGFNLYRTTSPHPRRACCAVYIFRSSSRRTS